MAKGSIQAWVRDADGLLVHSRAGNVADVDAAIAHLGDLEVDDEQATESGAPPAKPARKRAARRKQS
jgi:hypothetical protein